MTADEGWFHLQYTRILLAFLTHILLQINLSINPKKNCPCETYIVFSVIKMYSNTAESKETGRKLFLGWFICL